MRTYQATSMSEALKLVKRDLGDDAVILHTRTARRGGLFGMGGREVVEVTAATDVNIMPRRRPANRSAKRAGQPARPEANQALAGSGLLNRAYGASGRQATRSAAAAPAPGSFNEGDSAVALAEPPVNPAAQASAQPTSGPSAAHQQTVDQLNREMRQIRSMLQRVAAAGATKPRPDMPEPLFNQYLSLLEQEVAEDVADEIVQAVRQELDDEQLNDEKAVRQAIMRKLACRIPVDEAPAVKRQGDRPMTIALIGPTGVGKTTTLAKLAATFKLKQQLNVAMITIDTYRIAAVDQLRTYANIIGVPLHVVLTPLELTQALGDCRDCDVVLIDTAGRSQRDSEKLEQLQAFINAANPHETHLVLSSTAAQPVLLDAVERFSRIPTDRVIFTKLDEAVSFGVVLNIMSRIRKKLSYVTTGQEVPHQIEPGKSERLASLLLGESL